MLVHDNSNVMVKKGMNLIEFSLSYDEITYLKKTIQILITQLVEEQGKYI